VVQSVMRLADVSRPLPKAAQRGAAPRRPPPRRGPPTRNRF